MNIAMLTTWNSVCGISEYSENLMLEFLSRGHKLIILGNKTSGLTMSGFSEAKIFGVHWWGEDPRFDFKEALNEITKFQLANGEIDVLFVQYQSSLYEPEGFNRFLKALKCKKIIVKHDSSVNPKHDFSMFDGTITHNLTKMSYGYVYKLIPFPTIELQPTVFSFGMGDRNDYDFIQRTCEEIGVDFCKHDARKDGWISENLLFQKMNDADAIVLWYNEVPIQGQSSALRTAISSMRPVIVNDVGWFSDAPGFIPRCQNKEDLIHHLKNVLHLDYIRENSYANCAAKYLEVAYEITK